MSDQLIQDKVEQEPIPLTEASDLQLFLEAFFSPIGIIAWMFLFIMSIWLYCEIFIFK